LELRELLSRYRPTIREKWYQSVLGTYPEETSSLLTKKGRISNPVGYVVSEAVDSLLDGLIKGVGREELSSSLFPLVQVRAVQSFSPSEAVSFVHLLKEAVRGALGEDGETRNREALGKLDAAVEELVLVSFDIYVKCREKIFEVREGELKRNLYMLLRQSGLVEHRGP
jgi:hypothetical protein